MYQKQDRLGYLRTAEELKWHKFHIRRQYRNKTSVIQTKSYKTKEKRVNSTLIKLKDVYFFTTFKPLDIGLFITFAKF